MGGKRDKTIEGVDWYPSAVGDLFILVLPNGMEVLQRVAHFEDATHWGSRRPSFAAAMELGKDGKAALPRWHMRPRED